MPRMRLSRADYHRWVEDQPKGRFERVAGEPVAMAPERWVHAQIKARVWRAFDRELRRAGLPCEAAPDGMTVEIGEDTDYEPDALINCGQPMPDDAIAAPDPVVIVEVLSPSTRAVDTGGKLADYCKLPSVQHYLLIRPVQRDLIHHRRDAGPQKVRRTFWGAPTASASKRASCRPDRSCSTRPASASISPRCSAAESSPARRGVRRI